MDPNGCSVAKRHSVLVPRSLWRDSPISICMWWGPSGAGGNGGAGLCCCHTAMGWAGCPCRPLSLGCLHPWQLAHRIQLDMPASSWNIAGNVSLMRLKSAGSLVNYVFTSVVGFHASVPSPFPLKAACWAKVWLQEWKSLCPNSSGQNVIPSLSRVSSSFEPFVSLFWDRTVNVLTGEIPTQDDWTIHSYDPSLCHIKASTRKYQNNPWSWKYCTLRSVLICCHRAVSWVPKPKSWQSPEEMTANTGLL